MWGAVKGRTKQAKWLTLQYSHIKKCLSYPHSVWETTLGEPVTKKALTGYAHNTHTHTQNPEVILPLIQSTSDKPLKFFSLSPSHHLPLPPPSTPIAWVLSYFQFPPPKSQLHPTGAMFLCKEASGPSNLSQVNTDHLLEQTFDLLYYTNKIPTSLLQFTKDPLHTWDERRNRSCRRQRKSCPAR